MRRRQAFIGVLAGVLGVACAGTPKLFRQPTSPFIDAWLEWSDTGEAIVRVAVDVPVRELQLPGEPGAPDVLVVSAVLLDSEDKRVASEAWRTDVPPATAISEAVQKQSVLRLRQAGRHTLRLGILLRGRVVVAAWQRRLDVPPFPAATWQLAEPVFLKPGSTQPLLSRVYEDVFPPRVRSSVWIPAQEKPRIPVQVAWNVAQGSVEKARGTLEVEASGGSTTSFELQLPRLSPGSYGLALEFPAGAPNESVHTGARYSIVPRIEAWADSLPGPDILEVVLSASAFAALQEAPRSQQLRMWRQGLEQMAPGFPAVALDLLQHRWQQASLQFIEADVPGWQTARGRVYIRRGPPDEIDSLADPDDSSRIERWRYRRDNHVFVFRDARGSGVFVLERTNDPGFP